MRMMIQLVLDLVVINLSKYVIIQYFKVCMDVCGFQQFLRLPKKSSKPKWT